MDKSDDYVDLIIVSSPTSYLITISSLYIILCMKNML